MKHTIQSFTIGLIAAALLVVGIQPSVSAAATTSTICGETRKWTVVLDDSVARVTVRAWISYLDSGNTRVCYKLTKQTSNNKTLTARVDAKGGANKVKTSRGEYVYVANTIPSGSYAQLTSYYDGFYLDSTRVNARN